MFYHSIGESFGGDRKAICIIHCLLGCLEKPINLVMKKPTLERHMYISFVYIYEEKRKDKPEKQEKRTNKKQGKIINVIFREFF